MIRSRSAVDFLLSIKINPATLEQDNDTVSFSADVPLLELGSPACIVAPSTADDRMVFREFNWASRSVSRILRVLPPTVRRLTGNSAHNLVQFSYDEKKMMRDVVHRPSLCPGEVLWGSQSTVEGVYKRAGKRLDPLRTRLKALERNVGTSASVQAALTPPIQLYDKPWRRKSKSDTGFYPIEPKTTCHFLYRGRVWTSGTIISAEQLVDAITTRTQRADRQMDAQSLGDRQRPSRQIPQTVRVEVWRRDGENVYGATQETGLNMTI